MTTGDGSAIVLLNLWKENTRQQHNGQHLEASRRQIVLPHLLLLLLCGIIERICQVIILIVPIQISRPFIIRRFQQLLPLTAKCLGSMVIGHCIMISVFVGSRW